MYSLLLYLLQAYGARSNLASEFIKRQRAIKIFFVIFPMSELTASSTRKARPGMWARRLAGLHPKLPCISVFATSLVFVFAPVCPLCLFVAWRSQAHWNSEVLFGQVVFTSIQWLPLQWSAPTTIARVKYEIC